MLSALRVKSTVAVLTDLRQVIFVHASAVRAHHKSGDARSVLGHRDTYLGRSTGVFRACTIHCSMIKISSFGQPLTTWWHRTIVIFREFDPFDQQAARGVTGKNGPPIFIALREGLSNWRKPKSTFFLFGAVARDTPCFKDGFDLGEKIGFF